MKHKALFFGILALGFGVFTLAQFLLGTTPEAAAFKKSGEAAFIEDQTSLREAEKEKIVFVFGGDVMLGRMVNYELKRKGDYGIPFQNIKDVWQDAAVVMVNLESPLTEDCPVRNDATMILCAETGLAGTLREAGVNIVSFANNHYLDYGNKGWQDTNKYLGQAGIGVVNQGQAFKKEIQGREIGFLSWNLTWDNVFEDELRFKIQDLGKQVDFLVVNYHWGDEYQDYPNEQQKRIAHLSIEAGADLIIGHHPHHAQTVEEYQGRPIFYSLGNLIFDQLWSEKTRQGMLVRVEWQPIRQGSGQAVSYKTFSTRVDNWVKVRVVD